MAKKSESGAKPRKPRKPAKPSKASVRRRTAKKEEVIEPEDIETVEEDGSDHAEADEFEAEIEMEVEDNYDDDCGRRSRRRRRSRSQFDDLFGEDGPFGRDGPFGGQAPFGAQVLFGPGGLFGQKRSRGGGGSRRRAGGGFGGAPQKRRRMFGSGELRLVLLAMLAEEARHGYELIKALEEMTDGAYSPSPGIIYPTLQMLNDEAVIAVEESDDARKLYQATDAGRAELEDRADEVAELWERLGRRAQRAKPKASADLFRSLGNLATVLTNKASKGGMSNVDQDQVIDLIDALARKIERL